MSSTWYRTFGSYRLVHPLGSSCNAFRALHQDTGETYVVKIFHGNRVLPETWADIGRALRAFPARQEPVCAIKEVGMLHGEVYAVAPYLDGENLSKIVKAVTLHRDITKTSLHHRVSAYVVAELARGLISRGNEDFHHPVFGPDMISPDDLFVLFDGSVRVLDFAWTWLRCVVAGAPWSSIEHNLAYMIPEEEPMERPSDAGRAWALGVLLWELLVGYRLFRRFEVKSTLRALNQKRIPHPRSLNPSVPESLAELSMKLLSKPGAMTLREMCDALHRESRLHSAEAPEAIHAWLGQLTALRRESGHQRVLQTVDAILDVPEGAWPETEASTTCIIAPPSVKSDDTFELSWLEDDPRPQVKLAGKPISRSHQAFKVAGLVALVLMGMALSVVPAVKRQSSWVSAWVNGMWSRNVVENDSNANPAGDQTKPAVLMARSSSELSFAPEAHESESAGTLEHEPTSGQTDLTLRAAQGQIDSSLEQRPEATGEGEGSVHRLVQQQLAQQRPARAPESSEANLTRTSDGSRRIVESRMVPSLSESADVEAVPTGDLLVRAPKGTRVLLNDRVLGTGAFSVRLPAGSHVLNFHSPGQQPTQVVAQVRPGALSIVTND